MACSFTDQEPSTFLLMLEFRVLSTISGAPRRESALPGAPLTRGVLFQV